MSELAIYSCIMVFSALVSSISQIMLKKSAQKKHDSKLKEYLNPFVLIAYILFVTCTLISILALKVVPLSMAPILEATGYIFVSILGYWFLNEKLTVKQLIGMFLIIIGIIIYSY